MKVNHREPGSVPKSTEKHRGLESNLAMTKHGQSGPIRSHVSDKAPGRREPNIGQAVNFATYNVRTMSDTIREKTPANFFWLRETQNLLPRHTITSTHLTESINYQRLDDWTMAYTTSSVKFHGVAHLDNKIITALVLAIDRKSDRIFATHINGSPKLCIISA